MTKITQKNRMLFMAIMLTSLLQMAMFALTPGIAKIQAEVFPNLSLSAVQTTMTLPSLLSMVFSVVSSFFIANRLISKKACVIIGVSFIAGTGLAAIVLHTQFWHLCLLSGLLGTGMGFYIAPSASIMFDRFNATERRLSVGYQTSFINFGGIVMSIGGGLLTTVIWYGGYMMLFLAIPIIIICLRIIPNDGRKNASLPEKTVKHTNSKIPADIFYYGIISLFFLLIYNVCNTNISNHLKDANIGNSATAGIATGVQMAGGVLAGFIFNKLSAKFKDYVIPFSFFIVFIGYTIINIGQLSLLANFIGVFIVGTAVSIIVPQMLFSTSNRVDASNSAASTAIVNCILPGIGGFLSPVVFTNLTTAIGGDSTKFRFEFVGIVSLVFSVILVMTTVYRTRKEKVVSVLTEPTDS